MGVQQLTPNLLAGGTIRPYRFVKLDTTDNKGVEANAGELVIGVSEGDSVEFDSDNAATTTAGDDSVRLQSGRVVRVEAGGTFTAGDKLMSNADGEAVAWTSGSANYVAGQAIESATDGALVDIVLNPMYVT